MKEQIEEIAQKKELLYQEAKPFLSQGLGFEIKDIDVDVKMREEMKGVLEKEV